MAVEMDTCDGGPARVPAMCAHSPGLKAAGKCEECTDFRQGVCRGRDSRVPLQVTIACTALALIMLGASYFS